MAGDGVVGPVDHPDHRWQHRRPDTLTRLAQRKLHWTPQERELLWRTTLGLPEPPRTDYLYRIPIAAIKHLTAAECEPLLPYLRQAQREIGQCPHSAGWMARRRLEDLLSDWKTCCPSTRPTPRPTPRVPCCPAG
nr:hypothetical protein GCM10020093_010700 [Planobispora longispora]